MATVAERTTRFVLLGQLGRERSAEAVRECLITTVQDLPSSFRGILTWDQGPEMSKHRTFSLATNVAVYFASAGSPWQRGTHENTNGLRRRYLPKSTDLAKHTHEDRVMVAGELSGRPGKSIDWGTPVERMTALLEAK